jgi:FkbM family methyltransferase
VADQAQRSGANSPPIRTWVPGQKSIDLVSYYLHQADYYPECELQTKRWFVENVRPDWIMFDVGANIGYYSILFSRLAPAGQIFAFEPTETFSMLQENLAHHGCRNVKALQIAVGMVSGSVEDDIFRIWGAGPERRAYNFSTVDDLVQKLKLTRLDCIKIDVDSFDFEALKGAKETLSRLNPWVIVELCHALSRRNQSAPQALEWLARQGAGLYA